MKEKTKGEIGLQQLKWVKAGMAALVTSKQVGVDLLLPPSCPGCGVHVSQNGTICPSCWGKLRFITRPFCPVMGIPFSYDMGDKILSSEALQDPPPFAHARAVVEHDGLAQKLVSALKYASHTELAPWMAHWMVRVAKNLLAESDMIIPIPLHPARFWRRGYNQSAELARTIARKEKKLFYPEGLVRHKRTKQQVGLDASARRRNVAAAFLVPKQALSDIGNRHIMLIDDVFTTGATARAGAKTLLDAGAKKVDVLTFSHAIKS